MNKPSENKLILAVDDEPKMIRFIRMNLELEGYRVSEATNGMEALEKTREELPDLVLLDVMMPDMNGFETLQHIRKTSNVPVIMLTVQSEEEDIVRGLALGADDYVTKPFSPRELTSRIKALLRRAEMPAPIEKAVIEIDDRLSIDFQTHEVWVEGNQIRLRPTEYRLLYHLVNNAGWVMSREMLLSKVWGPEYRDEIQYLRLYINYLRQKIEVDPAHPNYILTERGVGYRFVDFRQEEAKE
jgi:two-component system KDP operon response regulator KdpE